MGEHVHYDLEAMERQFRRDMEATHAQAYSLAPTDEDRRFCEAQRAFNEAVLQMSLAGARLQNEGHDGLTIAAAYGCAMGRMQAQFLKNYAAHPRVQVEFLNWYSRSLTGAMASDGHDENDSRVGRTSMAIAIQGSRA